MHEIMFLAHLRAGLTLLLLSSVSSQPTYGCTTTPLISTSVDGATWEICLNSNYIVPTVAEIISIKNHDECAQICSQFAGCTRAVYNKLIYTCDLKGNSTAGEVSPDAESEAISLSSRPNTGDVLSSCPYGQYNITTLDGSEWSVCPNSRYQAATLHTVQRVTSQQDCAQLCSHARQCTQSVFDSRHLQCSLKTGKSTWIYNKDFQSIDHLRTPQASDLISSCSAASDVTSSKGHSYTVCQDRDFDGNSTETVAQTQSAFDCMLQCDSYNGCTKASYNATAQQCSLKNSNASLVYSPGVQSVMLVNGSDSYRGNLGKWLPTVSLPVVPAGAFIVPEQPSSHRILAFSSYGSYEFFGPTGYTQFADYNWRTGAVSHRNITNTYHDMFCPGMSFLPNGTLMIDGGADAEAVSFYDYKTDSFTRAANMNIPRGYQSSVTLSDGSIFTIGGSYSGGIGGQNVAPKVGEVYNASTNTWSMRPGCDVVPMLTTYDAEGAWRTDNHAWLYAWKDASVLQGGPSKSMHWYNPAGEGSVFDAGVRDAQNDTMCGVNVMYDAVAGKIFSAGGSQSYTNSPAFSRAHLITLQDPYQQVSVETLSNMVYDRGFANAVVLPDGTVLITGGQAISLVFTDIQSIYAPELWDPTTKNFTTLAPAAIPRNYHSVSLLLADATVWSAGGGMCPVSVGATTAFCDQAINHFDGEIFQPPYLFNNDGTPASRPKIVSVYSDIDNTGHTAHVGGPLAIVMQGTNLTGHTFSLIRLGSSTHTVNTDQRRVPLHDFNINGSECVAQLPADSGILIPGFYYVFAINAQGTPSEAMTIQVKL